MGITSSWKMIVEEVFERQEIPPVQRRPNGHIKTGATKKGSKKRALRGRLVSLVDEEGLSDEDDDGHDWPLPVVDLLRWLITRHVNLAM